MPYGTSTVQAFTEALQTNLQARLDAANEGVTVWDGWPSPEGWNAPDWIMLGDVEPSGDSTSDAPAINSTRQPRDERYVLAALISCARQTRTAQRAVNERAFALLDYLNQELRGNPRQGVSGVMWAVLDSAPRLAKGVTDKSRECHLEIGVRVRARM